MLYGKQGGECITQATNWSPLGATEPLSIPLRAAPCASGSSSPYKCSQEMSMNGRLAQPPLSTTTPSHCTAYATSEPTPPLQNRLSRVRNPPPHPRNHYLVPTTHRLAHHHVRVRTLYFYPQIFTHSTQARLVLVPQVLERLYQPSSSRSAQLVRSPGGTDAHAHLPPCMSRARARTALLGERREMIVIVYYRLQRSGSDDSCILVRYGCGYATFRSTCP